jgi:hypothetical protein
MNCLELFSGTGSVNKVFKKYDIECISLDIEERFNPTILCDIMEWNYKEYPQNYFDIITASPVCCEWSLLKSSWIGRKSPSIRPDGGVVSMKDIEEGINLRGKPMVDKMFEIIQYFKPKYYWIENPKTSRMWKYIQEKYEKLELYYNRYDYCKYSSYGYMKPTIFATNFEVIPPMICKKDCENMVISENKKNNKIPVNITHKKQIGNLKHKTSVSYIGGSTDRDKRYRIPPRLIEELLESIYINMYIEE